MRLFTIVLRFKNQKFTNLNFLIGNREDDPATKELLENEGISVLSFFVGFIVVIGGLLVVIVCSSLSSSSDEEEEEDECSTPAS